MTSNGIDRQSGSPSSEMEKNGEMRRGGHDQMSVALSAFELGGEAIHDLARLVSPKDGQGQSGTVRLTVSDTVPWL